VPVARAREIVCGPAESLTQLEAQRLTGKYPEGSSATTGGSGRGLAASALGAGNAACVASGYSNATSVRPTLPARRHAAPFNPRRMAPARTTLSNPSLPTSAASKGWQLQGGWGGAGHDQARGTRAAAPALPVVIAGPFLPADTAPVHEPLMRAHVHDEPQRWPASIPAAFLLPVCVLDDGIFAAEQFHP
jgi:hypothetical protein